MSEVEELRGRVDRLEKLVTVMARRGGLLHYGDAVNEQAVRHYTLPAAEMQRVALDPIGALRAALAGQARKGRRTWPMAIDHVPTEVVQAATSHYALTVSRKLHPASRSSDGFEAFVLGRGDHVISLEAA